MAVLNGNRKQTPQMPYPKFAQMSDTQHRSESLPSCYFKLQIIFFYLAMQPAVAKQIKSAAQHVKDHGYTVIKNFISKRQCQAAINEIDNLIENFQPTAEDTTVFDAVSGSSKHRLSKYFLDSSDKVSFFFEPKALVDGKIVVPKLQSINKIGHSLHEHNKIFEDITYAPGVWQMCQQLDIKDPLVMQSMAILKPPKIGAKVSIHQDSTYLYGQPDTLMGFWMPLQDATLKNGCLWGLPGSHKGPLYCRSKVIDREPVDEKYHEVDYKESDFVPLEMQAGSLAIFTGKFIHKSNDNLSKESRYAYTWHLMDSSSKWCPTNWLQRASFPKFVKKQ